jgi:hypothetical protein
MDTWQVTSARVVSHERFACPGLVCSGGGQVPRYPNNVLRQIHPSHLDMGWAAGEEDLVDPPALERRADGRKPVCEGADQPVLV